LKTGKVLAYARAYPCLEIRRQMHGQRLDLGVAEIGKQRIRLCGGSMRPGAAA
jgi:hypothetical protein